MTEGIESTASSGPCSDDCPFCSNTELKGYKTKHGALKKETKLASNMRSSGQITKENTKNFSGDFYELPGGNDNTDEWEADEGVFESFKVRIPAAPHHIIPGDAAMDKSGLEKWTCHTMPGSNLKEDIGYNIDCAQNGIFLPHFPSNYFTRYAPNTEIYSSTFYGQTWGGLSDSSKESIANLIMSETWLQVHFSDHGKIYRFVDRDDDDDECYDDECITRCNQLAAYMQQRSDAAKCKDEDGKLNPPYGLVLLINNKSAGMKMRITSNPRFWESWVSPLAEKFTADIRSKKYGLRKRGVIKRLTK